MFPLNEQFKLEIRQLYNERIKVPCYLAIVLVPLFGFLDYILFPDKFIYFMSLRIGTSIVLAALLFLSYRQFGKDYSGTLAFAFYLSVALMISVMIRHTGGYNSPYYAGLNLLIVTIVVIPWSMMAAVGTVSTIYGTYIFPILILDHINDYPIFINNNSFMLSTIIISLTINYVNNRLRFLEFKSRYELSELNLRLEAARQELEQSYIKLQELDEVKDRFFANISHELRTPITLILAPTDMMLNRDLGDLTPPQERYLKIMHGNALRLLRLINNMLDLSK
ncbi:MAG: sensor histidine kinase, partial [Thermodesulfobacteriota bacterium]